MRLNLWTRIILVFLALVIVAASPVLLYQYLDPSAGRFLLAILIGGIVGYLAVTGGFLWHAHAGRSPVKRTLDDK